jgi:drug/metabolite transporter (DMT)-like permease
MADPEPSSAARRQASTAAVFARFPRAAMGPLFMLLAAFASGCLAGVVRHLSADLHPFEIVFFRNLFALVVLAPWLLRVGWQPLRTRQIGWHALRAVLNLAAMMTHFYALAITPLAKVASLGFVAPLFATLFAMLFLRERLFARRLTALAIGFLGALIIVRPGTEAMSLGALLVLVSAAIWGLALIVIKRLSRADSSFTIAAYAGLLITPLSLIPALFVWQWPDPATWVWLVAVGAIGALMHMAGAQAFRLADATAVLPVDFTKLAWAAIIGYVFFGEVPEVWVWIGGIVIFASTVYIAYRESRERPPSIAAGPTMPA